MAKQILTQERLKELLYYSPKSGEIIWIKSTSNRVPVGSKAGSIHSGGYIQIMVDNKIYYAHRLVFLYMTGAFPKQVDHINHIRNDNRWINLRPATSLINNKNRSKNPGVVCTGLNWHKASNKWMARIKVERNQIYLGVNDSLFEACCLRKAAEVKYGFHPNHGLSPSDEAPNDM